MIQRKEEIGIDVADLENGATVVDTGLKVPGGFEAGRLSTKICLGGHGEVSLTRMNYEDITFPAVSVRTDFPLLTLMCQASGGYREAMEGWINFEAGSYRAIASGPARALQHTPEELFEKIGCKDSSDICVGVLQSDQYPDEKVAEKLSKRCCVDPKDLYLILTPLSSLAGLIQITGRTVEDSMVKVHTIGYDPNKVKYATGIAPLPPLGSSEIHPDDMLSYGSLAHLYIKPDGDDDLSEITKRLPSQTSTDYGKHFSELIEEHDGLRGIDTELFAPAEIYVNDMESGKMYKSGKIDGSFLKSMVTSVNPTRP